MKKHFNLKSYIAGLLTMAILLSSTLVFAESQQTINAVFGRVKLVVNNRPVAQETLLYNGTTYVPLRAAAEALNKEVSYDNNTSTAYIDDKGTNRVFEAKIETPPEKTSSGYIFELSDDMINNAINEGTKGAMHVMNNLDTKYTVPVNNKDSRIAQYNKVRVLHPYLYIARESAMASLKYETYSLDNAKQYYKMCLDSKGIAFELDLAEFSYEDKSIIGIGAFQDGKQIDIPALSGLTGFPSRSTHFPNAPSYERIINLTIPQDFINTSKPIEIKVNYSGVEELVYKVNLNDYK